MGYYGGLLARAGHRMMLLARGGHLQAMQAKGLEVRTPEERFVARVTAVENAEQIKHADYVIVSVKSYSLQEVVPAIASLAKSGRRDRPAA